MQKKFKVKLFKLFLVYMSLSLPFGCASAQRKVVVEKAEPKSDIELRRKLEEWTEQLHSSDPTIRSSAAVSLLGLNLLNAQEPLINILRGRKEREDVKISVIKAFGFTRDDRATDVLIELLDNESTAVQTSSAEALGMVKTRSSIRKMADAMLEPQRSLNAKIMLAKALGNTNDRDAVEPLIKMLAMNDYALREAAKKSLERITKQANGNDPAWWKEWWVRNKAKTRDQWLEDIVLKQEENTRQLETKIGQLKLEVAQKSIKLLETRPDKLDPKPLTEAIKSDYPDLRIFAAKELVKIKDPAVIDALITLISDEQEVVRIEGIQALGEIGDERAVKPIIEALDDDSLAVREKAANALGKLGKPETEEALISALNGNTDLTIVCSIIEALGQVGGARSVDHLIMFLSHKESKIRECTAAALGKLHDSRAMASLITALNDEQERVRWYAADSLGKIGDPVCVESLIKLLSDTSARVRESAVTALGQIGNQQSIESLIKALQDTDKRVAEQAAESLANLKKMSFETMDTIVMAFHTIKDYKRAESVIEKQIAEYAKQPELQEKVSLAKIRLAKTQMALKDWQKAVALYEEIVKRFAFDDSLKTELIQCLKELKQFDRVLDWYSVWVKETPQNAQFCWQGRLDAATALYEQGKYETVRGILEGFRMEDPNLGGEKFRSSFLELGSRCMVNLTDSGRINQYAAPERISSREEKK